MTDNLQDQCSYFSPSDMITNKLWVNGHWFSQTVHNCSATSLQLLTIGSTIVRDQLATSCNWMDLETCWQLFCDQIHWSWHVLQSISLHLKHRCNLITTSQTAAELLMNCQSVAISHQPLAYVLRSSRQTVSNSKVANILESNCWWNWSLHSENQ